MAACYPTSVCWLSPDCHNCLFASSLLTRLLALLLRVPFSCSLACSLSLVCLLILRLFAMFACACLSSSLCLPCQRPFFQTRQVLKVFLRKPLLCLYFLSSFFLYFFFSFSVFHSWFIYLGGISASHLTPDLGPLKGTRARERHPTLPLPLPRRIKNNTDSGHHTHHMRACMTGRRTCYAHTSRSWPSRHAC